MSQQVEVINPENMEITVPDPVTKKGVKTLTHKQRAFLSFLGGEAQGDIREAMTMAGYSTNTRPEEVVGSLSEEIIEISNKLISTNSVKAVSKLLGILDNPNKPGTKEVLAAAKELLDRAGIFKDRNNNTGTVIKTDNVFILPAKEPIDKPAQIG